MEPARRIERGGQLPPRLSGRWPFVGHLFEMRRDPLALMSRLRKECGEVGTFDLAGHQISLLTGVEAQEAFFRAPDEQLDQAAAYPFMKRITGWPQIWLGLVFAWAALVGWSEVAGALTLPGLLLYAGTIPWIVGYDTIYALQDREDDALIGIGSSALSMGRHVRLGVTLCYALALTLWAAAIWQVRGQGLALAALLPMAAHLLWQVATLKEDGVDPLRKFRSNRFAGLLMFLGCLTVGSAA